MKFCKDVFLTAFAVSYVDTRQPKPRTVHTETVVLDGGRISALHRLGMKPAGYIAQQYEAAGYRVANVNRVDELTAHVDLSALYEGTRREVEHERLQAQLAAALEQLGGAGQ